METRNSDIVPFKAVPPGVMLKSELEEQGVKQRDFAKRIGVQPSHLSELINGKRAITADIATRIEAALGIPAKFWLDLQNQYELDIINIAKRSDKSRRIA